MKLQTKLVKTIMISSVFDPREKFSGCQTEISTVQHSLQTMNCSVSCFFFFFKLDLLFLLVDMALNIFSEQARHFSHYLSEPLMTVCLLLFLRWRFPLHVEDTCMFPLLLPKKILVNSCHFKIRFSWLLKEPIPGSSSQKTSTRNISQRRQPW